MKTLTAFARSVACVTALLAGIGGAHVSAQTKGPATAPVIDPMPHPTPPPSVALYSGTAPGTDPKMANVEEKLNVIISANGHPLRTLSSIHSPSIVPYLPEKSKATGTAIILAPGGGHRFLAIDHEGYDAGRWFADHGVAAFVLKYRLARDEGSTYKVETESLHDLQRAIRLVRSRAEEWGVDPKCVGIVGFSAGGDLVVRAATQFADGAVKDGDAVDAISCRPDFHALLYPGLPREGVTITADAPPVFLGCAYDDRQNISEGLASLYLQYHQAKVPAELHIYGSGGHGFGVTGAKNPASAWTDRFMEWMADRKFLKTPSH